jgi:hypothetical protein
MLISIDSGSDTFRRTVRLEVNFLFFLTPPYFLETEFLAAIKSCRSTATERAC